jgi:hypothetical protein
MEKTCDFWEEVAEKTGGYDGVEKEDSFEKISKLWSAYLGLGICESDVCNMMVLLKVARSITRMTYDDYIDIAGYAKCAIDIIDKIEAMGERALHDDGQR